MGYLNNFAVKNLKMKLNCIDSHVEKSNTSKYSQKYRKTDGSIIIKKLIHYIVPNSSLKIKANWYRYLYDKFY